MTDTPNAERVLARLELLLMVGLLGEMLDRYVVQRGVLNSGAETRLACLASENLWDLYRTVDKTGGK